MRTNLLILGTLMMLLMTLASGLQAQNPFDIKSKKGAKPAPRVILESKTDSSSLDGAKDSTSINQSLDTASRVFPESPLVDTFPSHPDSIEFIDSLGIDSTFLQDSSLMDTLVQEKPEVIPEVPEEPEVKVQEKNKIPWYAPWMQDKTRDKSRESQIFSTEKILNYVYIFLVLGLVAFLVNYDRSLVDGIFRTLRSNNELKILYREEYIKKQWLFILNYVIYVLVLGYIVYKALEYYTDYSIPGMLVISIIIVISLLLIRHLTLQFMIWLTRDSFDFKIYNYQIVVGNIILGYCLLPILLLLGFGPSSFYPVLFIIVACVVVIFYLFRQVRAFSISSNTISMHTFQFFLYLCAIEIFPLAIAIKMAFEGINL